MSIFEAMARQAQDDAAARKAVADDERRSREAAVAAQEMQDRQLYADRVSPILWEASRAFHKQGIPCAVRPQNLPLTHRGEVLDIGETSNPGVKKTVGFSYVSTYVNRGLIHIEAGGGIGPNNPTTATPEDDVRTLLTLAIQDALERWTRRNEPRPRGS